MLNLALKGQMSTLLRLAKNSVSPAENTATLMLGRRGAIRSGRRPGPHLHTPNVYCERLSVDLAHLPFAEGCFEWQMGQNNIWHQSPLEPNIPREA